MHETVTRTHWWYTTVKIYFGNSWRKHPQELGEQILHNMCQNNGHGRNKINNIFPCKCRAPIDAERMLHGIPERNTKYSRHTAILYAVRIRMGVSKNHGTPQIINFNRLFHYKHIHFEGFTPMFGNIQILHLQRALNLRNKVPRPQASNEAPRVKPKQNNNAPLPHW